MARTTAQRTRNTQRPSFPLSIARKEIGRFIFSYSSLVSLTTGNCDESPQAGEIVAAVLVVVNFNVIPAGDFVAPVFIHAQTPAGVEAMKRLKAEIKYQFEGELSAPRYTRLHDKPYHLTESSRSFF